MRRLLLFYILTFAGLKGFAFDLYTHLWISQQVLNDIINNKSVTLNNKKYSLTDEVRNALINNPSEFRMGTLGPDVFPDPVVGQITAHPGLPDGWKTDDWIQHILNSAVSSDEIAFAYGYACHAAMDVFAHTYVNAYSGDIFLLTDSEIDVELRHFALEKYIGLHIPPLLDHNGNVITDYTTLLSTPKRFLTNAFILNNDITTQYIKSGSLHLVAMNGVYKVVQDVDATSQEIVVKLSEFYLNLLKEKYRLALELDKKIGLTKQLELNLRAAEEALKIKREVNEVILKKLEIERDIIDKGIKKLADIENIIARKNDYLKEANKSLGNLESEIVDIQKQVLKITTDIALLPLTIPQTVVEKVCNTIFIPYPCPTWRKPWRVCNAAKLVCDNITKVIQIANPLIANLKSTKDELLNKVTDLNKRVISLRTDITNTGIDIQKKLEEKEIVLKTTAASEANEIIFKAQKEISEKELEVAQKVYDEANKIYEETKKEKEKLEGQLEHLVDKVIKKTVDLVKEYNLIHLYFTNWTRDIQKGCDAYIEAGQLFSQSVISKSGNGFSNYTDWYKCWKPVFTGIPSEIPQAACLIENYYNVVNDKIDKIILEDLGVFGWLVAPNKKLQNEVKKKIKPVLDEAATQISNIVFGKTFTDFFNLISARETLTTGKLIEIYQKDESGKNLISFNDITNIVNKEMGLANDASIINFENFSVLYNAIVLSKMTVLPASSLNKIHFDYLGNKKTIYGDKLYPETVNNRFTLLYRAISVIDGSCQWMNTALPLYRGTGFDLKWPNDRRYGYSRCNDNSSGFRFWVDPKSRSKIFNILFKGPLYPELYAYSQSNPENRKYIPCTQNPFPNTETKDCELIYSDTYCPDTWIKRLFKKWFGKK